MERNQIQILNSTVMITKILANSSQSTIDLVYIFFSRFDYM